MSDAAQPLTLEMLRTALVDQPLRYQHIAGVVKRAKEIEESYRRFDGDLVQTALYHDCGYAACWQRTGFHPIDGAMLAEQHGRDPAIVGAVLYHSGSWLEAKLRRPDFREYYEDDCRMLDTPLSAALTFCDLHTGLDGQYLSLADRLSDIRQRHSANPVVLRVMDAYEAKFQLIDRSWSRYLTQWDSYELPAAHYDGPR